MRAHTTPARAGGGLARVEESRVLSDQPRHAGASLLELRTRARGASSENHTGRFLGTWSPDAGVERLRRLHSVAGKSAPMQSAQAAFCATAALARSFSATRMTGLASGAEASSEV